MPRADSPSFAAKLHGMLQDADKFGFSDIISWQSDGESFMIHQPESFTLIVMRKYFTQTVKYKSFQRQLNIYGFRRVDMGPNKGAYRQRFFKREKTDLLERIARKSPRRHSGLAPKRQPRATTIAATGPSSTTSSFFPRVAEPQRIHYQQKEENNNKVELLDDGEMKMLFDIFYPEVEPEMGSNRWEQDLISSTFCDNYPLGIGEDVGRLRMRAISCIAQNDVYELTAPISVDNTMEDELDSLLSFVESDILTPRRSNIWRDGDENKNHWIGTDCATTTTLFATIDPLPFGNYGGNADATDDDQYDDDENEESTFPFKLHCILSEASTMGYEHAISWIENGTAFKVHDRDAFVNVVMPKYFDQTKYESFRRQLNMYGFKRINRGERRGVVYHPSFLENNRNLCRFVGRQHHHATSSSSSVSSDDQSTRKTTRTIKNQPSYYYGGIGSSDRSVICIERDMDC